MDTLFVNAAFRDGSRSLALAESYLELAGGEVEEIDLGHAPVAPLDARSLAVYNAAVAAHDFADPMFDVPRRFARADEIVIAAPFWNYSIPAALHDYLELVCTQGLSFDIDETGTYHGMCAARRLTYITTAGGPIPEPDYAFGYVAHLARSFWDILEVRCYKAECLDVYGCDVEAALEAVRERMRADVAARR